MESGALFVAAAVRTSKGCIALMFWAVSCTLNFIVGCNRWDPSQFFRSESQMCVKGHWRAFAFLLGLSELALRFVVGSEGSFSVCTSF